MRKCAALFLVFSVTGCAEIQGTEFYRAENFQLTKTRETNVGLVMINRVTKTDFKRSFDKVYGSDQEFLKRMRQLLVGTLGEHSVRVVPLSAPDAVLERAAESLVLGTEIGPAYLSEQARHDLSRLASRSRADMIFVVRHWYIFASKSPAYVEPMEEEMQTLTCVVVLEGGIFDARGEMLFFGSTKGKSQITLFFYKTALESAVADAAEKYAEMMTGAWPDEQLEKARYRAMPTPHQNELPAGQ